MEAFNPSYDFAGDRDTPGLNPDSPGKKERAGHEPWLQEVSVLPIEGPDYDKPANGDQNAMTADVKHVLGLNLHPHQVALIRDARHESGIVRIYDRKGNEISYKFGGGMEQFKQEYKLDEPFEPESRRASGPWKRLQDLGRKVKKGIKGKAKGTRLYEVETWSRRLDR